MEETPVGRCRMLTGTSATCIRHLYSRMRDSGSG